MWRPPRRRSAVPVRPMREEVERCKFTNTRQTSDNFPNFPTRRERREHSVDPYFNYRKRHWSRGRTNATQQDNTGASPVPTPHNDTASPVPTPHNDTAQQDNRRCISGPNTPTER
eukprot:Polyplicarium_translucidae@DN3076_c0_g2_i1.p4